MRACSRPAGRFFTPKPTVRPYGAILAAGFGGEARNPGWCIRASYEDPRCQPFNEAGAARGKHPANPAGTLICEGTPQNERFAGCKNHLFKSMVRYCHLVLHFSLFP